MLAHSGHATARKFFTSATATSYDSCVKITTFGQDAGWKREIIRHAARSNAVLDLACGTGILTSLLRSAGRQVVGLDLTQAYLLQATKKGDLRLSQGTAEVLPFRSGIFDAVVSSYLAKYVDIDMVVQECWRVLQPGGVVVFHDFTCPSSPAVNGLWKSYFSILKFFGTFFKSWQAVFTDLDSVIIKSRWVDNTKDALHRLGFQDVTARYYTFDTAAMVVGIKP